jgi:hypothetical protein
MVMQCRSVLHFLLKATMALHIKHMFVINSDDEVLILAFFVKIVYRCSRFIFITAVLKSQFLLVPQKHSKYKNLCMQHKKNCTLAFASCWFTKS